MQCFHHYISSFPLGPNILLSTLFRNATASSLQIALSFSQQATQHYKIYSNNTEAIFSWSYVSFLTYRS